MGKFLFLLVIMFHCAKTDRVYREQCPAVNPMPDFDMQRFLGVWYQVQPEQDPSEQQSEQEYPSCEFYTVTQSNELDRFVVNTQFDLYTDFVNDKPVKYESYSKNYLDLLKEPGKFNFNPPAIAGGKVIESNFTIFATDYETYAVISNCDKEMNSNDEVQFTQHTTLWSRTRNLADDFVDNIYATLGSFDFDFDPYDLSSVSQTGCIDGGKVLGRINLDEQTES